MPLRALDSAGSLPYVGRQQLRSPATVALLASDVRSGSGAVWQRTSLGDWGSWVQIPPPRPFPNLRGDAPRERHEPAPVRPRFLVDAPYTVPSTSIILPCTFDTTTSSAATGRHLAPPTSLACAGIVGDTIPALAAGCHRAAQAVEVFI